MQCSISSGFPPVISCFIWSSKQSDIFSKPKICMPAQLAQQIWRAIVSFPCQVCVLLTYTVTFSMCVSLSFHCQGTIFLSGCQSSPLLLHGSWLYLHFILYAPSFPVAPVFAPQIGYASFPNGCLPKSTPCCCLQETWHQFYIFQDGFVLLWVPLAICRNWTLFVPWAGLVLLLTIWKSGL